MKPEENPDKKKTARPVNEDLDPGLELLNEDAVAGEEVGDRAYLTDILADKE
ncbi:MAG: hypothetical protein QMC81_04575 [Thermoanaerobacterales bacterium]|nr:hypothetical protein [Bacillota bacterium]MDI6906751.1 hypothetical protein [Thermoanaerobacterales bacterium]